MYATSKLIIPPKPARNSPYIPKLRIKLKPSLNRSRLVHGTSLRNTALVQLSRDVVLRSAHPPRIHGGSQRNSAKVSDGVNAESAPRESEYREETGRTCDDGEIGVSTNKRTGAKRKQMALEMDNLDLEGPESVITKVSLKALINRDTFYTFPVETQRMLADLLPYYDRQQQCWPSRSTANGYVEDSSRAQEKITAAISPEDEAVWLHPSALSNEFFTKALQDYSDRQSRGEFAPRLRNRAGLRANAVGRHRYGPTVVNTDLLGGKQTQKHPLTESGSNYDIIRRTTRVKSKTYTTLSRQAASRSRNRAVESEAQPTPCSKKRMRSLSKNVRRSQNLSSCKELAQQRMTLREKGSHSVPGDQDSSQEFPPQTYPETIQTSSCSASDAVGRSPGGPGFSTSIDDSCSVSSTSTSFTPKLVKSSPSELSNTSCRNTSARTPSLGSPQGLDLCDGLDTPFNLIHAQKLDESVSSPRSVRRPNCSPSAASVASDSKPPAVILSPRSGRNSRGLSSSADSTVPLSMPPPRQTKTLAAMREKLRAKRMLKEAERHPSSSGFYSLPGSMTPHPASGACGYFHQPSSYTPQVSGFGSPFHQSVGVKRSSSALSSPQNPNSNSPTNCDKQPSVSLGSLNGTGESTQCKLIPNSPSSPHSLPNAELSSPLLNSSLSNDFLSHISLQDSALTQDLCRHSYPSSPVSTSSSSGMLANSGSAHGSSYSPQPVKTTVPMTCCEARQEQSVSAPPTPVLPQAGQTMLTFSPIMPAAAQTSSLPNPGSTRLGHQGALLNVPISVSITPSLPVSHPMLHPQAQNSTRSVLSCANSTNSSPLESSTVVLNVNPSTPIQHHTVTNQLPPPLPPPPPPPSVPPPSSVSSPLCSSSMTSVVAPPELRANHSYPNANTVSVSASSVLASITSASSGDVARSQTTVSTAPSLTNQLSASAAVTKFLVGSSQNRPSTTTRAFFVDGDNLSEAVALLQSLNPKATITQQQFLLIPSSNKSQMFLCPTPSTSTPNILSVPVSNSASPTTTQSNGTSAPISSVALTSLSGKSNSNQTAPAAANLSGLRQLSINALGTMPNQMTVSQLVVPNSTTAAIAPPVERSPSVHPIVTNVILPNVTGNPAIPTTHGPPICRPRSLICTKSVPNSPLVPNTSGLVHLKPITKSSSEHMSDRTVNQTTVVMPRRTVAAVAKPFTDAGQETQSQIAFSLLAPNSSVIHSEAPVMFVSDTHSASYSPRHLSLNTVQSAVASVDRSQAFVSSIGTTGYASVASSAGPTLTAASAHMAVINPAHLTSSCDIHLQPSLGQQPHRVHSVPAQLHCTSSVAGEQSLQTIRATSISYTSSVSPTATPTYLSAATIVSPCMPAVVLPHTLTVQSPRTNVISASHSITNSHCINGTDHAMFHPVP